LNSIQQPLKASSDANTSWHKKCVYIRILHCY